jgi:hypothetical protein
LLDLLIDPEDGGDIFFQNRLYGLISQMTELFITTAVRTSNPP